MYGDSEDAALLLNEREAYFDKHNIECTCRVGYTICLNCKRYYGPLGKLRLFLFGRSGNV
jgi:hypothetical protein